MKLPQIHWSTFGATLVVVVVILVLYHLLVRKK